MRTMVVGFDAQSLTGKYQTGLGVYSRNLARQMEKHPETINLKLLWPVDRKPFRKTIERLVWEQYNMVLAAIKAEVDLIHVPCFSVPKFTRIPKVVTAHDLIVLQNPKMMPPGSRWYFSKWIPGSYHTADHIIAVSNATRDDLVNRLGINPEKITVIYHGINPVFERITDPHEINRIRFKYKVPWDFFLVVGSFEPRKNIAAVIEAFAQIQDQKKSLRLLLVGRENEYQKQMRELAVKLHMEDRVLFPGYIHDNELVTLYSVANAFIFPSGAEGFGLPLLEAMSTGSPIIASNLKVFREIGGDAVSYVPVNDPVSIAREMLKMLEDTKYRAEFIRRGLGRSLNFNWDHAAEETVRVYMRVLDQRGVKL